MVVDSTGRIWIFAITITIIALTCAVTLNFLVFVPEILSATIPGTVTIVPLITMPICLFVAAQMRDKALISRELQELVNRDRLTDAATRDFFFDQLDAMPKSYGVSLMVDIDHFKNVNDTYGHLAGDEVIKNVAQVLRRQVREQDIVCRFGGEEFVIFLREASEEEGRVIAERIRREAERQTTSSNRGDIKVTVSLGGSLKKGIEHIEEAIRRADDCLYRAKSQGRNCSVLDWDKSPSTGSKESSAISSRVGAIPASQVAIP